jgi:uncharacterized membrane protein YkvA (DUF1232 family)
VTLFGRQGLRLFFSVARTYMTDKRKTQDLIQSVNKKTNGNKRLFSKIIGNLQLLIEVLKESMSGKYKQLSKKSIVTIIAGLLYFVSPIDMIPDILLGFGFVDDIAVISFVINSLNTELQRFKQWKDEQAPQNSIDYEK